MSKADSTNGHLAGRHTHVGNLWQCGQHLSNIVRWRLLVLRRPRWRWMWQRLLMHTVRAGACGSNAVCSSITPWCCLLYLLLLLHGWCVLGLLGRRLPLQHPMHRLVQFFIARACSSDAFCCFTTSERPALTILLLLLPRVYAVRWCCLFDRLRLRLRRASAGCSIRSGTIRLCFWPIL